MEPKSETMSNVDAAWLSMDDPTNLMMITGFLTFKEPLNYDHFMAVARYRWLKFGRFRQRIARARLPIGKPKWVVDPYFDLAAHVHRVALPEPGDQAALQRLVSDLAGTPLDPTKALWQIHLVENYGSGGAMIVRIHHSIADGLALVYVLLSLTDMSANAAWPQPDSGGGDPRRSPGLIGAALGTAGSVLRKGTSAAGSAVRLTGRATNEGWNLVTDFGYTKNTVKQGAGYGYSAGRLLLLSTDPETPFKGSLGVSKSAAWSVPLPLADIKAIKNVSGATVNDVMVSAVSGALRGYLLSMNLPAEDFRAVVPVNMRSAEEMGTLGNKFGLVFLSLPVSIADPMQRLQEVHRRMAALKDSSEAAATLGILNLMGLSPTQLQDLILNIFASKATTVLTNVPGPPMPLYLAGSEIEDIMFWVPQAGRLGIGISILSYAGKVYLGVMTDAGLVPDPGQIVEYYYDEMDALKAAVSTIEMPHFTTPQIPRTRRTDDLTRIHGIDAQTQALLNENGIFTFTQLSASTEDRLAELLAGRELPLNGSDPRRWPAQARDLASL